MVRIFAILVFCSVALQAYAEPEADSEEQAVLDVRAAYDDPNPRPPHVEAPAQGSFGELAEPHLIALQKSYDAFPRETEAESELRRSVFAGDRPLSDLPPRWLAALQRDRAHVDGLLAASHASTGRLTRPLTFFGMFSREAPAYSTVPVQFGAKLANIEILLVLESHAPGAMDICLDELAVARDISRGSLIGQMVAVSVTTLANPTCSLALRSATPAERARFRSGLARVRAGWTSMATTLRQETAFMDLISFDHLSASAQSQLPADARLDIAAHERKTLGQSVRDGLFGGWARRAQVRRLRELERASVLPPNEADPSIDQAFSDEPLALHLAGADDDGERGASTNWIGFMRRVRTAQARLVILDAAAAVLDARDHLGRWPSSWGETGASAPIDPRTALPLELVSMRDGVRIQPRADGARTSDDLSMSLR